MSSENDSLGRVRAMSHRKKKSSKQEKIVDVIDDRGSDLSEEEIIDDKN